MMLPRQAASGNVVSASSRRLAPTPAFSWALFSDAVVPRRRRRIAFAGRTISTTTDAAIDDDDAARGGGRSYLSSGYSASDDDDEERAGTTTVAGGGDDDDEYSSIRNSQQQQQQQQQQRRMLQSSFPFPLDAWQLNAGETILADRNVIVCAPTGAGKTVVGEMALRIALERDMKAIYTTPLKALSNQKFGEMRRVFGVERVGLATGDVSIRRGADVTVMTTEVYRNMAWRAKTATSSLWDDVIVDDGGLRIDAGRLESASSRPSSSSSRDRGDEYSDLSSNSIVVLDEFHYMGQKGRGSTWEECVIFNPRHTQIVGLSATLREFSLSPLSSHILRSNFLLR
jgi:superfamily II RNA helicase